jgi:transposase
MEGHLTMSSKERRRKSLFDRVLSGEMRLREASERLGLSYRQTRRSYQRFVAEGDGGLVHRSRGRPGNRGKPARLRKKVLRRYRERYGQAQCGPTLAAEKLAQEGLVVDHETLRRWLMADGQWRKRRKRNRHRSRRERKHHFGELVQMDGSHHRWFGPQGAKSCLMNMVDDATGHTLSLMAAEETTEAAMVLLWRWVERYGIPKALYTDKKTVFVTGREPTIEEQLAGQEPTTAFGKACAKLDIEMITAHSPQAKGRVERNHGVYQDRFAKELVLRGITTIDSANKALQNGFSDELNAKFAKAPISDEDVHRPVPQDMVLEDVLCFEERRTVNKDWTVRHQNRFYQILEQNRPLPKPRENVLVRTRLDRAVYLIYRGRPLQYRSIPKAEQRRRYEKRTQTAHSRSEPDTQAARQIPIDASWQKAARALIAPQRKVRL